jgi:hypothetical protein
LVGVCVGKSYYPLRRIILSDIGEAKEMFVIAKAVLLALAVTGMAATGVAAGVVHVPMQKAIDIHKEHLGQNSTMPDQSTQGQQNALDHLMENQQRWMSKPHNDTNDPDDNRTESDID